MRSILFLVVVMLSGVLPCGCSGGGDDGPAGSYELWINDDYLGVIEITFLKGRCVGRANIDSQEVAAETALLAFGETVVGEIPLDGSSPTDDDQLVGLLPASPLTGELAGWNAPGQAWLITTTPFDWIDGSGQPFVDNGFEAVAGDTYLHDSPSWELDLEVVYLGDVIGAEAAFRSAGWDTGTRRE